MPLYSEEDRRIQTWTYHIISSNGLEPKLEQPYFPVTGQAQPHSSSKKASANCRPKMADMSSEQLTAFSKHRMWAWITFKRYFTASLSYATRSGTASAHLDVNICFASSTKEGSAGVYVVTKLHQDIFVILK